MSDLAERIDTIERGYEYLLAYAAQGRRDDSGSEVRATLTAMHAALDGLEKLLGEAIGRAGREAGGSRETGAGRETGGGRKTDEPREAGGAYSTPDVAAFLEAITEDARKARGAIALVLSRPAISSLLVDNLNASIHLRALLTDVFLVDQALKT
ncbi:MAG TPA: hypothetical protein VG994_09265 [Steroidobacteraceae bacterium]|nr:hypothetical protein [Steroidobacteraceae bacterium]